MTHDELLAKIELTLGTYISKYYGSKKDVELRSNVIDALQALRAVVELHKPNEFDDCQICVVRTFFGVQVQLYPCPTVQAIMGELE